MITSLCMSREGEHQGFKKVMEEIENDQGWWEVGKRRQTLVVRPGGYVGSNWLWGELLQKREWHVQRP